VRRGRSLGSMIPKNGSRFSEENTHIGKSAHGVSETAKPGNRRDASAVDRLVD
jgi:hypothetical protein